MNSSALISMMVKQKVKGNALQWNIFSALFLMLAMRAESRSSEKVIKYSRNCWKKWCCNQDVAHGMHVFKMLHLNRSLTKSGHPENKRILCVCRYIYNISRINCMVIKQEFHCITETTTKGVLHFLVSSLWMVKVHLQKKKLISSMFDEVLGLYRTKGFTYVRVH